MTMQIERAPIGPPGGVPGNPVARWKWDGNNDIVLYEITWQVNGVIVAVEEFGRDRTMDKTGYHLAYDELSVKQALVDGDLLDIFIRSKDVNGNYSNYYSPPSIKISTNAVVDDPTNVTITAAH